MNHRVATSALVAAFFVTSFACSEKTIVDADGGAVDAGGGGAVDGGAADGGKDLGECVSYTPANISGTKTGVFTSGDVVRLPLPQTDVGGGLLKVKYTQDAAVVASIFLAEGANPNDPRVETEAFGPGVGDGGPGTVYFRLAGKKTYELGIKPFSFDDTKPNYSVEYSYEPLVDCYEANDSLAAARKIPVNTTITAYHHTGIDTDDTSSVNKSGDDWYSFELTAETTVKLKGTLPGKDGADGGNSALFTVFAADGTTTIDCAEGGALVTDPVAATESFETCAGVLPAGTYFVNLTHFTGQPSASAVNASFNKSWNTPYTFEIAAQ